MIKKIDGKIFIGSAAMAAFVLKNGGTIVSIAPNKYNPQMTVFYFADDEKAEAAAKQWIYNAQNAENTFQI